MLNWLKGLFGGKAIETKVQEASPVVPATPVTPAAPDLTGAEEIAQAATEEVK